MPPQEHGKTPRVGAVICSLLVSSQGMFKPLRCDSCTKGHVSDHKSWDSGEESDNCPGLGQENGGGAPSNGRLETVSPREASHLHTKGAVRAGIRGYLLRPPLDAGPASL